MLPAMRTALFGGVDTYTKSLLHFDGAQGAGAPFIDSVAPTRVWSGGAGSTLNTANKVFGPTACRVQLGYNINTPGHADFDFGSGDFCVEWFEFPQNYTNGGCLFSRWHANTFGGGFLIGYWTGSAYVIYMTSNGTSWDIANAQSFGTVSANVWRHSAVSRQGNTFRAFKDGVITSTWTSSLAIWASGGTPVAIGGAQGVNNMAFHIDEFRVSKGHPRYTAAFTPPTAPFKP